MEDCSDVYLENVTVHGCLGMGVLAQTCHNVHLNNFNTLRHGDRYYTANVDATHFVNCTGLVKVENCTFEGQLDDAINIHGMYTSIEKVCGNEIFVREVHNQSKGIKIYRDGDKIQAVNVNSLIPYAEKTIKKVEYLNQDMIRIVLCEDASDVKAGDKLRVSGSTATYAGAVQFGQSTTYEKIGTATVSHPTPKTLDGVAADAYLNKSDITPEYVRVEGALSVSGNYYNLTIDGAKIIGSLTYPAASSGVSALNGKRVTVVGYVTGVVNGKYLNLLFTSVTEAVSGSCSHTNAVTVDAVDATCSADGYTGDLYCTDCGKVLDHGETIPKTGVHVWNETVDGNTVTKTCTECGKTVVESDGETGDGDDPDTDTEYTDVYALIGELEGDEEKILILINLGALDAELIELLTRNAK
jgi:hypothetical protein